MLTDVDRWPDWAPTVTSVQRLDEGPCAVGSRVRIEQPKIPPTDYEVTELVHGRSFIWTAAGPGVRTTARHLVERIGSEAVRVTLSVEQTGPLGVVMGFFYRRLTDRYLAAEAEGLKARSENGHDGVRAGERLHEHRFFWPMPERRTPPAWPAVPRGQVTPHTCVTHT